MKDFSILFWNLKGNDLSTYILKLLNEYSIDIALFAEYKGLNVDEIKKLNNEYVAIETIDDDCLILCLIKKDINYSDVQGSHRYMLTKCEKGNLKFNLCAVHLQSQLHNQEFDRMKTITDIKNAIYAMESTEPKTLIIGDFNIDPFDKQMSSYLLLNAVSFKDLLKNEFITHEGTNYKKFYNPMLPLISEENKVYGTYFYNDKENIYWHFYDQCLLRKALLENYKEILILKQINGVNLMLNDKPNKNISDHLPIITILKENNNEKTI